MDKNNKNGEIEEDKINETKEVNKKINIEKYQDPEGITMKRLGFGLWWLKNKESIKKILTIILLVVSIIVWGYTLFNWGYYYLVLAQDDHDMVEIMVRTTTVDREYLLSRTAKNLNISPVYMLESGNNYDFYVMIENPNNRHWGSISYCFIENSVNIDCGKTSVLPLEKKYILSLANDSEYRPKNIKFTLNNSWATINNHEIQDWNEFSDEHLDFKVSNLKFTPASVNELTEKINLNILKFTVNNRTPYNYYELPLNIVLFRNEKIVGVNRYVLKDFRSNKKEDISINWPGYIGSITQAEIKADINILRKDIYSP